MTTSCRLLLPWKANRYSSIEAGYIMWVGWEINDLSHLPLAAFQQCYETWWTAGTILPINVFSGAHSLLPPPPRKELILAFLILLTRAKGAAEGPGRGTFTSTGNDRSEIAASIRAWCWPWTSKHFECFWGLPCLLWKPFYYTCPQAQQGTIVTLRPFLNVWSSKTATRPQYH